MCAVNNSLSTANNQRVTTTAATSAANSSRICGSIWQPPKPKQSAAKLLVYKPVEFRKFTNDSSPVAVADAVTIAKTSTTKTTTLPKFQNPTITLLENARASKNKSNYQHPSLANQKFSKSTNDDDNDAAADSDATKTANMCGYVSEPETNKNLTRLHFNSSLSNLNAFDSSSSFQRFNKNSMQMSMKNINSHCSYTNTNSNHNNNNSNNKTDCATRIKPGRIENYMPGNSSIAAQETKNWWNEVFNIFDCNETLNMIGDVDSESHAARKQSNNTYPSNISNVLRTNSKNVVYKKIHNSFESNSSLNSIENPKHVYKTVQNGGDIPFRGLCNKSTGCVPSPELSPITASYETNVIENQKMERAKTEARAVYDFTAENQFELSLKKNDRIEIIEKIDSNWYSGRMGEKKGIFPASYVTIIGDERQQSELKPKQNRPQPQPQPQPQQPKTRNYSKKYKVLFKYKPQNDDELELIENDAIDVIERCDDGWFIGYSHATGRFGTFPGNFVREINN